MQQQASTRSAMDVALSHAHRTPADPRHGGGDFFTVSRHPDGTLSFAIGDVSAKGATGEKQARILCGAAQIAMMLTRRAQPILTGISETFFARVAPQGDEYTACVAAGTIDPHRAVVRYAAAGTEAAIVVRNLTSHLHLPSTGPLIGLSPQATFDEVEIPFESGCALLLYTDGIVEARGADGALLGTSGLMRLVGRSLARRLVPSSPLLLHEVDGYCGGTYRDDATLAIALAL